MSSRRSKAALVAVVASFSLLLAGCYRYDYTAMISPEGSMSGSISFGVPAGFVDLYQDFPQGPWEVSSMTWASRTDCTLTEVTFEVPDTTVVQPPNGRQYVELFDLEGTGVANATVTGTVNGYSVATADKWTFEADTLEINSVNCNGFAQLTGGKVMIGGSMDAAIGNSDASGTVKYGHISYRDRAFYMAFLGMIEMTSTRPEGAVADLEALVQSPVFDPLSERQLNYGEFPAMIDSLPGFDAYWKDGHATVSHKFNSVKLSDLPLVSPSPGVGQMPAWTQSGVVTVLEEQWSESEPSPAPSVTDFLDPDEQLLQALLSEFEFKQSFLVKGVVLDSNGIFNPTTNTVSWVMKGMNPANATPFSATAVKPEMSIVHGDTLTFAAKATGLTTPTKGGLNGVAPKYKILTSASTLTIVGFTDSRLSGAKATAAAKLLNARVASVKAELAKLKIKAAVKVVKVKAAPKLGKADRNMFNKVVIRTTTPER